MNTLATTSIIRHLIWRITRMRKLTILLLIISVNCWGQTVYVKSKSDKRYVAYNDSLMKYKNDLNDKVLDKRALDTCLNWSSFSATYKILGYGEFLNKPVPVKGTNYIKDGNEPGEYCLFYKYNQYIGHIFRRVVYPPKIKVVYKRHIEIARDSTTTRNKRTVYITKTKAGETKVDSTKSTTSIIKIK